MGMTNAELWRELMRLLPDSSNGPITAAMLREAFVKLAEWVET